MMNINDLPPFVKERVEKANFHGFRLADVRKTHYETIKEDEYILTFVRGDALTMRVKIERVEMDASVVPNIVVHAEGIELFNAELQRAAHVAGYETVLSQEGETA